jgi:hypothetical protein
LVWKGLSRNWKSTDAEKNCTKRKRPRINKKTCAETQASYCPITVISNEGYHVFTRKHKTSH